MKTPLRLSLIACLMVAFLGESKSVMAEQKEETQNIPAGLQEAFLAASSHAFSMQGGSYTTEYTGVGYTLNIAGLQAEKNGIQWHISLRGMGRGNEARDVQAPVIVQTEERLEYRRGALTEWYRDTSIGMEQGFTISESPQGNGRLVLHLDLSTDLKGRLDEDERGISFAGADGQILRYDHLKVYDTEGVELDARMIYNPAQVVIQVEDRSAVYPITIDPLISLEQKVIAVDGEAGDNFGYAVAMDGDTAVIGAANDDVGANANQGSAYIFVRIGTTWVQQAKLTASDGAADDYFGNSVAVSGDTALVGARDDDIDAKDGQGSAYVFVRSGTTWTQQAKLTASDGEASDVFGWSVALSGDTALVGAQWDDVDTNDDQGSAYVFTRSGGTWTQQEQLLALDGAAGDNFGVSVSLSGDTALVGAPYDDVDANTDQGSAYVFTRSGTTWTQQQQLDFDGRDGIANNFLGASVALLGDEALVGAPGCTSNPCYDGVFYERNGIIWESRMYFGSYPYGSSMAFSDNLMLVAGSGPNVAVFEDNSTGKSSFRWTMNLIYPDGMPFVGSSVAAGAGIGLVGAPFATVDSKVNQGAAYFVQPYRTDDLAVSVVTGSSNVLYPGDTILLNVAVRNNGPSETHNISLVLSFPTGLTYVADIPTHGWRQDIYWSYIDLPPGETATLIIQATVNQITTAAKTLTFSAASCSHDTNDANNSASLTLTVKKKEKALNGGFNAYVGTSKIPRYWTAANFASTDGKDTTAANRKEGTASVKISNTTAKTKTLTQTLSTLAGSAGDPFIFSYWVKGNALPAAGLCQAQVIFYNGAVAVGTPKTLACGSTGTFAYKQRKLSFIALGDYTKVIIKFTYSKPNSTVWFDLVSLLR